MKKPDWWDTTAPWGLKQWITWTPEAESHRTGLPLSDVLAERQRRANLPGPARTEAER